MEIHRFLTSRLLPGFILVAGLILTYLSWHNAQQDTNRRLQLEFEFRASEIIARIHDRLSGYEQILLGAVGLFNASDSVERSEFF